MPSFATRYYDFSCAHRSMNDPGKCSRIHGHNYRVHLTVGGQPDSCLGRVFDFGLMQQVFFQWIEENWDHRLLCYTKDSVLKLGLDFTAHPASIELFKQSIALVPFDPSTENMAKFLGQKWQKIMPEYKLWGECYIAEVRIEETRKCSASWQPE